MDKKRTRDPMEELEVKKVRALDHGGILVNFSPSEYKYFNLMIEEEAQRSGNKRVADALGPSEVYEITAIDRNPQGGPGFLDPVIQHNKIEKKTQFIRTVRYELTLNDDYIPLRDFAGKWDEKSDFQNSLEKKFTEAYRQMNSEIIKDLFKHPAERKFKDKFNPLGNEMMKMDPADRCHLQFTVANEVHGVADEKGQRKTYYQTRRIFPSVLFDLENPLPESLFESMFCMQINPESKEISNISFSLLIHLGYKDKGVSGNTKGQGVQTNIHNLLNKDSIIRVTNNDNLCLLHAYIYGLATEFRKKTWMYFSDDLDPAVFRVWEEVEKNYKNILKEKTIQRLVNRLNNGVLHFDEKELTEHGGIRMKDFAEVEKKLCCQIYMWDFASLRSGEKFNMKPNYISENKDPGAFRLCLIRVSDSKSNHVHLVTKPHCLFGTQHNAYCFDCFRSYRSSGVIHNCKKQLCGNCGLAKHPITEPLPCNKCNFAYGNRECFQAHIDRGQCEKQFKCTLCDLRLYGKRKIRNHLCGKTQCSNCNQYYPDTKAGLRNHECYIKPQAAKKIVDSVWIWDKESCLDAKREVTQKRNKTGEMVDVVDDYLDHRPNLIHLMKLDFEQGEDFVETVKLEAAIMKPWDAGSNTKEKYAARMRTKMNIQRKVDHMELWADPQKMIDDPDYSVDEVFLDWILEQEEGGTFIAHNGGSYDVNGLYAACNRRNVMHQHIKKDGSFVQFEITNNKQKFKFIDSLKFIQAPLAKLSKDFGLGDAEKLDFPYMLNTLQNYAKNLVLDAHPGIELYGLKGKTYGNKNTASYNEFVAEHQKQSDKALLNLSYEFNLNEENSWYCFWDVAVLACVWYLFRKECMRPIEIPSERLWYLINKVDDKAKEWEEEKESRMEFGLDHCDNTTQMLQKLVVDHEHESKAIMERKNKTRKLIESVVLHDPTSYLTIASYSVGKAMRMSLATNKFHVVREVSLQNQSQMAFQAATYMEYTHQLQFTRHAYSEEGEFLLELLGGNYLLDFVDLQNKTVFEFNGCRYHPCDKCRNVFMKDKDFEYELVKEKKKEKAIREAGFTLHIMKSCEFEEIRASGEFDTPEYQEYQLDHECFPPMKARDGCIGGSVNARVLWMDVAKINERKKEEKEAEIEIDYVDGTSLYPSQMVYGFFPSGKPLKLTHTTLDQVTYTTNDPLSSKVFQYIDPKKGEVVEGTYPDFQQGKLAFGRYMVRVLTPETLCDPLLKMQVTDQFTKQKKLMPIRCFTCCKRKAVRLEQKCRHSTFERSFVGVFLSCELNLALDLGYEILSFIHAELYEPIQGICPEYIREVFKLKLLSDGKAALYKKYGTFENLQAEAWKQNGIRINNEEEISNEPNPAMRQTAKIQINSAYGKFAQQPIKEHQQHFNSMEDLYEYLDQHEHEFVCWNVELMGSTLALTADRDEAYVEDNFKVNPLIAAFVTSYGRRDLYFKKIAVGLAKCLYEDTDSVVYWREKGSAPAFPDSDWLGGWKRELKKPVTSFFISLGPKTKYFKEDDNGEEHFSFKGFKSTKDFYDKMITNGGMKKLLFDAANVLFDACYEIEDQGASELLKARQGETIEGIQIFNKHKNGKITTSVNASKTVRFTNDKAMVFIPPGFVREEIISTTPW